MGELVKAAEALSAPATKLIEVVSRGIGRAYDPRYKKRMTDAAVYEIDALADAVRRNNDLPLLIDRFGVQLDARSVQELAERTQMRLCSQEMRKQQNIEAIIDKAYEELKDDESVSDEPVNDDWIVRFFNSVEDVSNDKLREIWGRILAGEIRQPGSSSFRTLETLKNMSFAEAELFEKLSFSIFHSGASVFIPSIKEIWNNYEIRFDDILRLDDAGIVNLTILRLTLAPIGDLYVFYNNHVIGIFKSVDEKTAAVEMNAYSLTETGKELLNVVSPNKEKSEFFALEIFKYLGGLYSTYQVSAHRITDIEGKLVNYQTFDLL